MTSEIVLRPVVDADLPLFFEFQRDPEGIRMAAFTAKDPHDREAFDAHWGKIRANPSVLNRTIEVEGEVVGSVGRYFMRDEPQVTYWIARAWWGRGIASAALARFIETSLPERPLFASVAFDNEASRRVLEKCGFRIFGQESGFAHGRGEEVLEILMRRDG